MVIKVYLEGGEGKGEKAFLDDNNALLVSDTGVPPDTPKVLHRPYSALFKSNSGATDMRVDGSVKEVDFFIGSADDADRFVHTIAFVIADAQASFGEFGNLNAPLNDGCQLFYNDLRIGDVTLGDALKTNFDFVQLCGFEPTFGTGSDAFRSPNVSGSSEAYHPVLDVEDIFGLRYGIRIPMGTLVKLTLRIRDDVSGVDRFDVRALGFDKVIL